jgi:hypothetical protein
MAQPSKQPPEGGTPGPTGRRRRETPRTVPALDRFAAEPGNHPGGHLVDELDAVEHRPLHEPVDLTGKSPAGPTVVFELAQQVRQRQRCRLDQTDTLNHFHHLRFRRPRN